jgi:hypothetical protein
MRSLSNGKSLLGSLLLCQSDGLLVVGALYLLCLLGCNELDMAVGGKVGSDSAVGSVGSSSTLDSALNSEVADDGLLNVEALCLSVSLKVLKQLDHVSD